MKKLFYNPITMLFLGFLAGFISLYLDCNYDVLGSLFSKLGIWVLFGVAVTYYADSLKQSCFSLLFFCLALTGSYYLAAELFNSYWHYDSLILWLIISFLTPLLSYLVSLSRRPGTFGLILKLGILFTPIVYDFLVQDINLLDIIIYLFIFKMVFLRKKQHASIELTK